MTDTTSFADKLVAKAKDLGLPPQTETVIRETDKAVHDAVRTVGTLADTNRDKIVSVMAKAEQTIDEKTEGKYADTLAKVRAQAEKGLDKVAEKRGEPGATYPEAQTNPKAQAPTEPTAASAGSEPDASTETTPEKPTWETVDDAVRGEDPQV